MKKFRFRLEAIERHRKLQEQERQVQLARSLERMRATEARLFELDLKEVQARREFAGLGSPGRREPSRPADFWLLDQFIRGQKTRRVDLKEQLEIDEQGVRQSYRDFLHARQQKKIMEKLRERKLSQFRDQARRSELRSQDEQYVTRDRLRERGEGGSDEE